MMTFMDLLDSCNMSLLQLSKHATENNGDIQIRVQSLGAHSELNVLFSVLSDIGCSLGLHTSHTCGEIGITRSINGSERIFDDVRDFDYILLTLLSKYENRGAIEQKRLSLTIDTQTSVDLIEEKIYCLRTLFPLVT